MSLGETSKEEKAEKGAVCRLCALFEADPEFALAFAEKAARMSDYRLKEAIKTALSVWEG
jgi:hypothetical protein